MSVRAARVASKKLPSVRPPSTAAGPRHSTPLQTASPRIGKGPWIIGGLAIYSFAAYGFYLYSSYERGVAEGKKLNLPTDVSSRYDQTAEHFDEDVDFTEKITGLMSLRKKLASNAQGNVLEVSVGTGRNMQFYDLKKCKSLTVLDQSPQMLEITRKKFKELHPFYKDVTFINQSAVEPITMPEKGFDTVFQTMGLCSTPDPVGLLRNLGRSVNPETGHIYLLEHGVSHYAWLNRILNDLAPVHANKHGCWWNKDIGAIVAESGLEIVQMKRYHLGTTWWVELRPAKS